MRARHADLGQRSAPMEEEVAVRSLEHALKGGTFLVRSYQRGYRWSKRQVLELCEDINGFALSMRDSARQNGEALRDGIYFLQPVIVRKEGQAWELIDGQQRLTTLFLMDAVLCRALRRKSALSFGITYEIRQRSGDFLKRLAEDPDHADSPEGTALASKNVDFYSMAQACRVIRQFFHEHAPDEDLYRIFTQNVCVLWYDVTGEEGSAEERFTRLNMGRIPLTCAELCRALLLSAPGEGDVREKGRKSALLGTMWDDMERSLREEDFMAFLGGDQGDRMGFLLDLYTGRGNDADELFSFHAINRMLKEKSAEDILRELSLQHEYLRFWYEDNEYYHLLGYLNNVEGKSVLRELLKQAKTSPKAALRDWISGRIRKSLNDNQSFRELEELNYLKDRALIQKLLFLFNVEYARRRNRRFPFRIYRRNLWSLEHIQAQNVEELHTKDQWQTWAEDHEKALSTLRFAALPPAAGVTEEAFTSGKKRCTEALQNFPHDPTQKDFEALSRTVLDFMKRMGAPEGDDVHSLFNLALLDQNANSSLNNSLFVVKRMKILEKIKNGEDIPPATEAVFLRYFTEEEETLPWWSEKDREGYAKALHEILDAFRQKQGEATA